MRGMREICSLVKLYAAYSLVTVVVKVVCGEVKRRKKLRMLIASGVPRAKYNDSLIGSLPDQINNMDRRFDFFTEMASGQLTTYHQDGPKFDPQSIELLCRDPVVVKHFLKDNFENYTKRDDSLFWHFFRLWLGEGIFVASHGVGSVDKGSNWLKQRKIASAIFSRGNFNENMGDVFVAKGQRLCELLRAPAARSERVDMQAKFFQFTMDSIMQIFFGEASDTMGGESNKYALAFDSAHQNLMKFIVTTGPVLVLSKFAPWPFGGLGGLAHKIHRNTHPLYRRFCKAWRTLDSESRRMIANTRSDPALAQRKDLLALFIQQESQLEAGWLRDMVLNFVIAGRDTTACTLSWMFYILATHPEIQQKLQAEIDAKFKSRTAPTIQSVSARELPYLNGVIYETLRLYPPVPMDGKEAVNEDVLPDGTRVPAGTRMLFLPYAMGRDAKVYAEPECVVPERWIPFKEPSPFEFPVFQGGQRVCLGMNMALFEVKICAAMVLRDFSFEMEPGEAEKITYLPTAVTMSICNTKGNTDGKYGSQNLWLVPKARQETSVKN